MALMRTATVHDLPGVYRVCLRTGAAGADASGQHMDPDLLGHLWAGPYLVAPGALALVVQGASGLAGYVLAASDTTGFEDWMEHTWLPPLRDRLPRGSGATPGDRAAIERIHLGLHTDPALLTTHPAHLHIDLLPRLQGQGWGRLLIEAALDALAGACGVHVGVDPANTAASGFYTRLGFASVGAPEDGFLGMPLPRP